MIIPYRYHKPMISEGCYISESAQVIGKVTLEENVNVWPTAVIRGDVNDIYIGENTNIQDGTIVHVGYDHPTIIKSNVTIGHRAIVHGCTVDDYVLIGMGAIILNGAQIGEFSIIGAGSVVTENTLIPAGKLALGTPARVIRDLTEQEKEGIKQSAYNYVLLSKEY